MMLKINYPVNNSVENYLEKFESEYKDLYAKDIKDMQKKFSNLCKTKKFEKLKKLKITDILVMDFESLFQLACKFKSTNPNNKQKEKFQNIFNYANKYQPRISSFFVKNSKLIGIRTCYFCNLEYINSFADVADYLDFDDFINNAPEHELENLQNIGPKFSSEIIKLRLKYKGIGRLTKSILEKEIPKRFAKYLPEFKDLNFIDNKYYFTLDHVLDKASNPLAALSLYNFVPCCTSCNSKFKTTHDLVTSRQETYLSPTSKKFKFSNDNKFKMYFKSSTQESTFLSSDNDFSIKLKPEGESYKRYEKLFKLNSRYKEHKSDIFELFNKRIKYPRSKINDIASTFNLLPKDLEDDLFGKEVLEKDLTKKPKSKLLFDINNQIINVKKN